MVVISINVTNDCSIKTITVHWLDIKFDIRIRHESGKPEHFFPDSKPHSYIDFMSSQLDALLYCLYICTNQIACLYTVFYCLLHLCIRMFFVFLCNINHCNDSAPCWDLDWTIKSYLILDTIFCPLLMLYSY